MEGGASIFVPFDHNRETDSLLLRFLLSTYPIQILVLKFSKYGKRISHQEISSIFSYEAMRYL